jgi:hypothetical protein
MSYQVQFMKDDTEVASTPWLGNLASAKRFAREHLGIKNTTSGATSARVYDVSKQAVVYTFSGELDANRT